MNVITVIMLKLPDFKQGSSSLPKGSTAKTAMHK